MKRFHVPGRQWWFGAVAAALVAGLFLAWLKPLLERSLQSRIEAAALRHSMVARISALHLGIWPLLRLEDLDLDLGHGLKLQAKTVAATWPGRWRFTVRDARFRGPSGITASVPLSTWKLAGLLGDAPRLTLLEPQQGLSLRRQTVEAGREWIVEAQGLDLGRLLDLRRDAHPLLAGGIADGHLALQEGSDTRRFGVDLGLSGVRLGPLGAEAEDDPPLGDPTDVTLQLEGQWQRNGGRLQIPEIRATVAGAEFSGSLSMADLDTDPAIDLALGVRRLDFALLLASSGLEMPERLGLPADGPRDLGSVAIDFSVRGKLAEPASLSVNQTIDFKPPRMLPPAITRLRSDFPFRPLAGTGQDHVIDVSPASPDFIALGELPPLFLRTLLLAEDSAFYGHRGIDLREMPSALITNWTRGGAARGASTITQQLAKNLFLSRDKQVGRKLQELAITFLLEAALSKERILEIYLNIIEWGPDLRGLRPAARHYFGREPAALKPAEMAFLVSIIPGPILYQRSFASGTPGPGLRALIDKLLAKVRSVGAISEAEYQQALADPLLVGGQRDDASGQGEPDPLSSGP